MSFCKNQKPEQTPGPICGNPINNLKDKICIEVNKVFDACLKQVPIEDKVLELINIEPCTAPKPYTFVSASSNNNSKLRNIQVIPINDGCGCSRVKGNIIICFDVEMKDKCGNKVTAIAKLNIPIDIVMFIPKGAVIDTSICATISSIVTSGEIINDEKIKLSACITIIIKVIAPVDILIPTYGYCYIPPCQEYQEDICSGVFDMPLFPKDRE